MRKTSIIAAVILGVVISACAGFAADDKHDFKVIQQAVKQNAPAGPAQEVKWFKILVMDTKNNKEKVRVTLPIALIEAVLNCSGDKPFLKDSSCGDIDFKAVLAELRKAGPMALVEVNEEDELVKIWLE